MSKLTEYFPDCFKASTKVHVLNNFNFTLPEINLKINLTFEYTSLKVLCYNSVLWKKQIKET